MNVYRIFTFNNQKLEKTQMSTNDWMLYIHEINFDTYNNMYEPDKICLNEEKLTKK